jgi:hypothetical protein
VLAEVVEATAGQARTRAIEAVITTVPRRAGDHRKREKGQ